MRVLNWHPPLHLMTNILQPELMFFEEKGILKTGFRSFFSSMIFKKGQNHTQLKKCVS